MHFRMTYLKPWLKNSEGNCLVRAFLNLYNSKYWMKKAFEFRVQKYFFIYLYGREEIIYIKSSIKYMTVSVNL